MASVIESTREFALKHASVCVGIEPASESGIEVLPSRLETADELKAVAIKLGAPVSDLHLDKDATEAAVKLCGAMAIAEAQSCSQMPKRSLTAVELNSEYGLANTLPNGMYCVVWRRAFARPPGGELRLSREASRGAIWSPHDWPRSARYRNV
jgi:hypothetical protein